MNKHQVGDVKWWVFVEKMKRLQAYKIRLFLDLKGIAAYRTHANQLGYTDPFVDATTHEALVYDINKFKF